MNLYDQLVALQVIPHAFEDWADYRGELTQYVIEQAPHQGSLALFGAGRCNDLDLKRLIGHFEQVILLDRDEEAMIEALRRYGLQNSSVVQKKVVDFVGLSVGDYRDYADALVAQVRKQGMATDVSELADFAIGQLEKLSQKAYY
ncbi:MAG: hypothetical protein ACRCTE_07500, partial [Cellulosilyticaceae bacterium]